MAHGNEYQAERKYFYLKLPKNWFKNARIKKLRRIAGGDTYTIIYLKMLLMAMNHESTIIYEGVEPTIEEELSLKLDEETDNVKVTINFLKMNELWEEKKNGDVHLTECDSMVGSESYRNILRKEQKKRLTNDGQMSTKCQPLSTYKELEIDKELELEKDIEKDKENRTNRTNRSDLQSQKPIASIGYALSKILSDHGYIPESDIAICGYDALIDSWITDLKKRPLDLKVKIGYFLGCAKRREFTAADDKYFYFKTAMESSFRKDDSREAFAKMMEELNAPSDDENGVTEDDE